MKSNLFKSFATVFVAASSIIALSCSEPSKDKPTPGETETGQLRIEFDNVVGDKDLTLDSATYNNAAGEDFIVKRFNYFISNIKLTKADGSTYTVPQDSSYFLIKEDTKTSQLITLNNIPVGDYVGAEWMVGVDSLRNTAPIEKRQGVLDPAGSMSDDGMYWAWNSGYIFVKLEGTSSKGSPVNGQFMYHIGLFGGYNERTVNNTRVVKMNFGELKAVVSKQAVPEVRVRVDVLKFFNGPGTNLIIEDFNSIMGGQQAKSQEVANNYANMFTINRIQ